MTSAGPAWFAAAVPVSTKIPVPMMAPTPSNTSARASSVRCNSLNVSASCSSPIGLVENSRLGMADSRAILGRPQGRWPECS
jgi:hypothetical protein